MIVEVDQTILRKTLNHNSGKFVHMTIFTILYIIQIIYIYTYLHNVLCHRNLHVSHKTLYLYS